MMFLTNIARILFGFFLSEEIIHTHAHTYFNLISGISKRVKLLQTNANIPMNPNNKLHKVLFIGTDKLMILTSMLLMIYQMS